jgi:hypothetical protein
MGAERDVHLAITTGISHVTFELKRTQAFCPRREWKMWSSFDMTNSIMIAIPSKRDGNRKNDTCSGRFNQFAAGRIVRFERCGA